MFIEIFSIIFVLFVFAVIFMISELRKYSDEKKLRKLVSWSVIGDYCPALGNDNYISDFIFVIDNAQCKYGIKKYCITEETEEKYMCEILEEFRKFMALSYFKGNLKIFKSKYVIYGEHYFMLSLLLFLNKHECDSNFIGHEMCSERILNKSYEDSSGFYAVDALTDFAIVYYKMYYIALVYCKNCKPIVESDAFIIDIEDNIKKILDTKQIEKIGY